MLREMNALNFCFPRTQDSSVCTDSSGLVQLDSVMHPKKKRKEAAGPGIILSGQKLFFCLPFK